MHNTPTQPLNALGYALLTAELLDAARYLATGGGDALSKYVPALVAIAAERANELAKMLEGGNDE